MKDCVFCEIIRDKTNERTIYEDDLVIAFSDKHPVTDGHTLVVPRQHFENIFGTPDEILTRIMHVSKLLAMQMRMAPDITGVNIMNASGKDAQQSVFHLHFHVVPRRANDKLDMWFHNRKR